jgi:hypothetical protein
MNRTTPMMPEDDVRETPLDLFQAIDQEFGFTLDAAATHDNAKCSVYYTEAGLYAKEGQRTFKLHTLGGETRCADGLTGRWGGRVWLNEAGRG